MKHLSSILISFLIVAIFINVNGQNKQPNIVLIMADDIGQGDFGVYHTLRTGSKPDIPTPNIDKLASEGMVFTDAHSPASLCAPTRFSMMTGNYAFRNQKASWGAWGRLKYDEMDTQFTTIGRIAQQGGYTTAFFGKWGMDGLMSSLPKDYSGFEHTDLGPEYYGFNYSYWMPDGIQYHPYMHFENSDWVKLKPNSIITEVTFEQSKYLPEWGTRHREGPGDSNWDPAIAGPVLAEKATAFINRQKNADKPFFMYYCSQAVHEPHTPPVKLGKTKIAGKTKFAHGDMIWELDVQVGEIIKALKKNGMYDNTLIVITSDNGGLEGEPYDQTPGHDASNGWSGAKGAIEEGGHRVPFIASWPGKIQSGSTSDITIMGMDMVSTVAEIANISTANLNIPDSKSLLPVLTDNSNTPVHQFLIHRSTSGKDFKYALRLGDWKLIMKTKGKDKWDTLEAIGLYNLKDKKEEIPANNLIKSSENKERIKNMINQFQTIIKI